MRLASKDKEHIRYIRHLFLQGKWIEMCNEIWYYGEFDFAYDFLRHVQYKYKNEHYASSMYREIVDIYFSGQYNPNLMNPQDGEPRKDRWLEFYIGNNEGISEGANEGINDGVKLLPQRKTKIFSKKMQKILDKNNI